MINTFKDVKKIRGINPEIVKDSRNYYSHLNIEQGKGGILSGGELLYLTEKLRYLLICCVLNELGLSMEKIIDILDKYEN